MNLTDIRLLADKNKVLFYNENQPEFNCKGCKTVLNTSDLFIIQIYKFSKFSNWQLNCFCIECANNKKIEHFEDENVFIVDVINQIPDTAIYTILEPEYTYSNKSFEDYIHDFSGNEISHCVYAGREDELNRISGEDELQAKRKEIADKQNYELDRFIIPIIWNNRNIAKPKCSAISPEDIDLIGFRLKDIQTAKILKPNDKSLIEIKEEQLNQEWCTFKKEEKQKLLGKEAKI